MYQCDYCEDDKWIGDGRVPCPKCNVKPYSDEDYTKAKQQGFDLDNWNDYETYFKLGEKPEYE
jgi:hypothetical protein